MIQNGVMIVGVLLLLSVCVTMMRHGRWERAMQRFKRDRTGRWCLGIVSVYLVVGWLDCIQVSSSQTSSCRTLLDCFFKSVPREKSYSAPMAKTSYTVYHPEPLRGLHLLGTDVLGKDVFKETLKACRTALMIGGITSLIYIPIGVLLGILSGYFGRWIDLTIQYVYTLLASVPQILLLVSILMGLGKGLFSMTMALSLTSWIGLCRLIRGEALRLNGRPFVEAARALGQSHAQIIFRHILPNVMHLVVINFVLGFSGLVLAESILSYIGVGVPIGTSSWGLMIDSARMELSRDPAVWWNASSATLALFILVLSLNLLGDSLREAFDPRK